jgi:tetratricopeptide (TPR) repeat protein
LAAVFRFQGQFEGAERLSREGLAINWELGDRGGILSGNAVLSRTLFHLGRFPEALSILEESQALADDLGMVRPDIAASQCSAHLGRFRQARSWAQAGLSEARERGYRWATGHALFSLGVVALAETKYAESREWLQQSVAVWQKSGHRRDASRALAILGGAAVGLGRLTQAREHLCEALQVAVAIRNVLPLMWALPPIALLLAGWGKGERAVEIYALASRYPFVADSRWFAQVFGQRIAAVAETLPAEAVAAAQERGRARDLWATVEELLVELQE